VIDRMHSCQGARWSFWNVPGALERCVSPTAWVRERLARMQRCNPSRERGHRVFGCPAGREWDTFAPEQPGQMVNKYWWSVRCVLPD